MGPKINHILKTEGKMSIDMKAPVTTACYVLRLRMELPPLWRVLANISNMHSPTAGKLNGWARCSTFSPKNLTLLRNGCMCLGPGMILWYNLSNGKGT